MAERTVRPLSIVFQTVKSIIIVGQWMVFLLRSYSEESHGFGVWMQMLGQSLGPSPLSNPTVMCNDTEELTC